MGYGMGVANTSYQKVKKKKNQIKFVHKAHNAYKSKQKYEGFWNDPTSTQKLNQIRNMSDESSKKLFVTTQYLHEHNKPYSYDNKYSDNLKSLDKWRLRNHSKSTSKESKKIQIK